MKPSKNEFIISQGYKLNFNQSMRALLGEYERLKKKGIDTERITGLIEEKVDIILHPKKTIGQ